jgi:hypothetical protein
MTLSRDSRPSSSSDRIKLKLSCSPHRRCGRRCSVQECQGLALRDGRHRRAAAGIDLFGVDHARWLGRYAFAAVPSLGCASSAIALSRVILAAGDFASAVSTVSAARSVSKAK